MRERRAVWLIKASQGPAEVVVACILAAVFVGLVIDVAVTGQVKGPLGPVGSLVGLSIMAGLGFLILGSVACVLVCSLLRQVARLVCRPVYDDYEEWREFERSDVYAKESLIERLVADHETRPRWAEWAKVPPP